VRILRLLLPAAIAAVLVLGAAAALEPSSTLLPAGEIGEGEFGWSVALSDDGQTALVGAPQDAEGTGAAWLFTRSGAGWTPGPKLIGGGEVGQAGFGFDVALSANGSTAIVGAPGDNGVGAVWVFTRSGGVWTQQGPKLTGGGGVGDSQFGNSVALSADGDTALVAGAGDDDFLGAAWVFARTGSTWAQQGPKLTPSDGANVSDFGFEVGLSGDGATALGGTPYDNEGTGAAWVFTRSGGTWGQQGPKLTAGDETESGAFGYSVTLSGDGNTALVGGPYDGPSGAAWIFTRSGTTWAQSGGKLTASDAAEAATLGWGVALSSDGRTALVGGPYDGLFGAVWTFTRQGETWSQSGPKVGGSGPGDFGELGWYVAVSADGRTGLAGDPVANAFAGSATVLTAPTVPGAPTDVTAEAGDASAAVHWLPPASDGGRPVTGYVVTPYAGGTAGTPIAVGPLPGATLTGLANDTAYTFTVTALNAIGAGPESAPSAPVTPNVQGRPLPAPPVATARPEVPTLATTSTVRPPRPPHH
jgi:hypothetical protein